MSVLIRNLQSSVKLNLRRFRLDIDVLRRILMVSHWKIGISFIEREAIRQLNRSFRGHDKPTDVLSFSFHNFDRGVDPRKEPLEQALALLEKDAVGGVTSAIKDLGDLYICPSYVKDICVKRKVALEDELAVLSLHGIAHLLGHKHEDSWVSFRDMYFFESEVLAEFDRIMRRNLRDAKEKSLLC